MFARLGRWCYRRRPLVIVAWVLGIVIAGGILGSVGTETRSEFDLPDVESRRGAEILEDHFDGTGSGNSGSLVFRAEAGIDDPAVRAEVERLLAEVGEVQVGDDGTLTVRSPYAAGNERQVAPEGPLAGRVAYATLEFPGDITAEDAAEVTEEILTRIEGGEGTVVVDGEEATRTFEGVEHVEGLDVYRGGMILAEFEEPSSEILGVAFAIVILIVSFGSVLAMGLPIGVALAGVGLGTIVSGFLSHVTNVPEFATMLGVMIGLGVGIDYALFIVTRFRENLHNGMSVEGSTVLAMDTAGRAVTFAGTTVVISLLGMVVMQMGFITGLAVTAATVVAVTMLASVTLLPALLGFAGSRVEVTRWRGLVAAGLVALVLAAAGMQVLPLGAVFPAILGVIAVVFLAGFAVAPLRREVPRRVAKPTEQTFAYRWSRLIQRRPWTSFVVGVVFLGVLAVPVFGLRLAFSDEGNYPEGSDTRIAYDLLGEAFGPGSNGPFVAAAEIPAGTDPATLTGLSAALDGAEGVEFAGAAAVAYEGMTDADRALLAQGAVPDELVADVAESGGAMMWSIVPETAPQDEATTELVHHLRDDVIPAAVAGSGVDPAVAGSVPVQVDFSTYLSERLVVFFAAVLALSFLLLMMVFRSVLVPLKAVVMNLLSIGAAFGVIVAIFQWGWGASLLGIDGGPIEPFIPMMLFAIVFGLSMDYEVFLLSRVKEEWDRTGDSHQSVADGLAATARVITAAALIMVFVFGSFMFESNRTLKLAGLGLATAVFLDATVVRMLLVPATMELLGDRNWWVPRWLDRLLPRIEVEGHTDDPAPAPDTGERELEKV